MERSCECEVVLCLTDVSTPLKGCLYSSLDPQERILLSRGIPLSLQEDATLLQTKLSNFAPLFTVGTSLEFSLHYAT